MELTKSGVPLRWKREQKVAFEKLKEALTTAPVLAYPDFSKPFVVDTDESDVAIGAVLGQSDAEGHFRVITYGSRVLNKAERNYSVTERECLSVVEWLKYWRHYLLGQPCTVVTDHHSLQR